jgi:hypothetical protein
MSVPRCSALLAILALAGCGFGTNDEPFSLNDGDALPTTAGVYSCAYYDDAGNRDAQPVAWRLIALPVNKKLRYVVIDEAKQSAVLATLHRAKGNLYVVAFAGSDSPGEGLYLAEFLKGNDEFRVYDEGADLEARAHTLARARGVTIAHPQYSGDELGGPVEAQKAFIFELASALRGWRLSADCRLKG